jgi:hypothetical protein
VTFWGKLKLKLFLPLLLSFVSVGLNVGVSYVQNSNASAERIRRKDVFLKLILVFYKVTMILFTMLLSSIAAVFDCVEFAENHYVLRNNSSVTCYKEDWKARIIEISFFIILYLILFPTRLLWILYKMIEIPKLRIDPAFSYLTNGYKPSFFWWDAVQLLKRMTFVLFSQFLFSEIDSSLRIICSIIVFLFFATIEVTYVPFQFNATSKNNQTLMLILILLSQGLVFDNEDSKSVQIFVMLVLILLSIIITHSLFVIFRRKMNRINGRFAQVNEITLEMLSEPTREELFQLHSSDACVENQEVEFRVEDLQSNQKDFLMKEILSCRRLCDVEYGYEVNVSDHSKDMVAEAFSSDTTLERTVLEVNRL